MKNNTGMTGLEVILYKRGAAYEPELTDKTAAAGEQR